MSEAALRDSALGLPLVHRGKVRDVYDAGEGRLLLVASDRVSAFDVVLSPPVPRKGEVLTLLTAWWLERLGARIKHHLLSVDPEELLAAVPALADAPRTRWARRSMLVIRTEPVPVECVVRGYLAGSAWSEYRTSGTLAGEPLPAGLSESARLEPPVFSPATKARTGHDENITYGETEARVGAETAARLRALSLEIYAFGARTAAERGILLADTKLEFGHDPGRRLLLIDEVMTPDSSRFWPADRYEEGRPQASLDKQPIRDWLAQLPDWTRTPPAPDLPPRVVAATTERYLEVFERLTGSPLDAWAPPRFGGIG